MSSRTAIIRKNVNKGDNKITKTNIIPRPRNNEMNRMNGVVVGKNRNKNDVIFFIFFGLGLFWLGASYQYALSFLNPATNNSSSNIRHAQKKQKIEADDDRNSQHQKQPNNPYQGWQPKINSDSEEQHGKCNSWRKCFEENHACPGKCRDGLDDWGKPPPLAPVHDSMDKNNQWIPDVTVLRRMIIKGKDSNGNPWPPPLVTKTDRELCEPIGVFGGKNDENSIALNAANIRGMSLLPEHEQKQQPKVLYMVYTMEENHHTSIRAIRETWGGGCDGFLAFSTKDDKRIPAISLKHDGPESYGNMWQKVRSIWRFVGTHYLEQFDYFFQGGEDLYVLPQNLRHYLANSGITNPTTEDFFGGRRFNQTKKIFFNSGGAGYVLSQATLRKFVNVGLDHPKCFPNTRSSMEDVMIARCLKDVFNIGLVDTRDGDGRERFHPFAPGTHYYWKPPVPPQTDWYEDYNRLWPPKLKEQCCAPDSVSFHYMKKPSMVRHIHALLYFCD